MGIWASAITITTTIIIIILIIRLSDPQGELLSTCQRSSPPSRSPMSLMPPSHSSRGSTGNYLNILLNDKDNSKKKTKEGMTDVFLCRQTQQVELPLYYNAYRAPNQQVVDFFSCPSLSLRFDCF